MNKMIRIFLSGILWLAASQFPASAATGEQPEIDAAELEQQIHQLINRQRQSHGLPEFDWDNRLAGIAAGHSRDMAEQNFFSHVNLRGEDPSARGKRQGWNETKPVGRNTWAVGLAENIFLNHLYNKTVTTTENGVPVKREYLWNSPQQIAHSTVQGWMHSAGHRKNILSRQYDREGIGVVITGNDIFITEDLF